MSKRSSRLTVAWAVAPTLALLIALLLAPGAALAAAPAQEGTLDPAVLAALQRSAALVAGAAGGAAVAPAPVDEPVDEPSDEPVALEDVVIGETVEVSGGGISVLVPDTWTEGNGSGSLSFEDEATGFRIDLNDSGSDFPGLLLFPIVEGNVEAFLTSLGNEAELVGVSRLATEDGMPVLRVAYANGEGDDGELVSGAIYFVLLGNNVVGIFSAAPVELWPAYEAATDAMVTSILADEEFATLQVAGDEGAAVEEPSGRYSLTVPPGWYFAISGDAEMAVAMGEPTLAIVAAIMAETLDVSDEELQEFTEMIAGTRDDEELSGVLDEVVEALNLGAQNAIAIDESRTATLPGGERSVGTIRVVGDVEVEEGVQMPVSIYLTIFPADMTALIVFGEPDAVAAEEATLLTLIDSIVIGE